uniref:Uncharacterized protein n=1 Tax=Desertifilum tharense IPPAS B-1220 TaxID=1781255 RepID=A0A1E5QPJ8_9CYAN|nr:hypothetical protein BH720_03290 [Desertifilum tharense IPPAS B-1220]
MDSYTPIATGSVTSSEKESIFLEKNAINFSNPPLRSLGLATKARKRLPNQGLGSNPNFKGVRQ